MTLRRARVPAPTHTNDVRSIVYRHAAAAFDVSTDSLRDELTPFEIETWDSLTQLQLVLELEAALGIVIEPEDAFRIVDVASIIEMVEDKLGQARRARRLRTP